tara:strand:+ start:157 stop:843 length:687 start_codon:yes stop_codon:yes gene_type:complete
MKKLYTYGCSFTQGMWEYDNSQTGEGEVQLGKKRIPFEYGTQENWGTQLAKDLNLEYINVGLEGSGPLYSISQVQKDLAKYEKDDLVILQLSYADRKFSHLIHINPPHSQAEHRNIIERTAEWIKKEKTHELENDYICGIINALNGMGVNFYFWITQEIPEQWNFVNKYDKHRLIFDGNDTYVQWMHSRGSKMMYYDWSVNPLNPVDIHQNIIGHTAQKEIFKRQIQI